MSLIIKTDILYLDENDVSPFYKNRVGTTAKDIDFSHIKADCFRLDIINQIKNTPVVIYKDNKGNCLVIKSMY